MERTVPSTGSEEIELYLRTYYSLLRTTSEIQIRTLEEVHAGMGSLLHPHAREQAPDMSAFIYTWLRLPDVIWHVGLVVLGQSAESFIRDGQGDVETWQVVTARARRRRCFYNGQDTMACYIASRSDIDDIIPLLTAYQIEWNKLHYLLLRLPDSIDLLNLDPDDQQAMADLAEHLMMDLADLNRLAIIWEEDFNDILGHILKKTLRFRVRLLGSSFSGYRRVTKTWLNSILEEVPGLEERPVYFVSSNTHSLVNILTGFAHRHKDQLLKYVDQSGNDRLRQEWNDIKTRAVPSSEENYFYYLLKIFLQSPPGLKLHAARDEYEKEIGITRVPSEHCFDLEAQVIDLSRILTGSVDRRLVGGQNLGNRGVQDLDFLAGSDALIFNIDYPLGLAAYNILSKLSEINNQILGLYIMGKSATLNGVIGDVMIPDVVHDEHSGNTYLFANCFTAADAAPYLVYGTVLDNQKAVTVQGTFLQNTSYMDVFYREGYTDIEMEAGPYLSALYEMYRPIRYPVNEIVNLYGIPVDLGILHYASDTPLSKGKNLGAGSLSYFGMDPTYATTLAILKRIFYLERLRLGYIPENGNP